MKLLDGAIGTSVIQSLPLRNRRRDADYDPCLASIEHPELVTAIHTRFLQAGAEVVRTNSFMAAQYGGNLAREICIKAVECARKAAETAGKSESIEVWGSLGIPSPQAPPREISAACATLREAGCSKIILETIWSAETLEVALKAIDEPEIAIGVIVSLYPRDARFVSEGMKQILESGVKLTAVALNCFRVEALSSMPEVPEALKACRKPVALMPCGPTPAWEHILALKPDYIGGCCNTTATDIEQCRRLIDNQNTP
jgi:methionine synthase I (cobalamin-dependent)